MPAQIAFLLLSYCALPRLSFLARTTPPELLRPAARRFDELVLQTFHAIMQLPLDSKLQPVPPEQLRAMLSLPLKAGSMGLRPVERTAASAYFASGAAILPEFILAFPADRCADYTATELHAQLEACRELMRQQGVADAVQSSRSRCSQRYPKAAEEAWHQACAARNLLPCFALTSCAAKGGEATVRAAGSPPR